MQQVVTYNRQLLKQIEYLLRYLERKHGNMALGSVKPHHVKAFVADSISLISCSSQKPVSSTEPPIPYSDAAHDVGEGTLLESGSHSFRVEL